MKYKNIIFDFGNVIGKFDGRYIMQQFCESEEDCTLLCSVIYKKWGELDKGTMEEIQKQNLDLLGVVPQDDDVYRFDCEGRPTVQLPADSPVREALKGIIEKLGI